MDDPRDELVRIDATGTVHPVGKVASQRLRSRTGAFRLMPSPAHVLVMRYVGEDGRRDAEDGAILRLAGEITAPGTLCDVVALAGQAGWRGELVVLEDEHARSIFFEHGHVVAATSTVADERIGQVLFRYGALTEAQVAEVLKRTTPERRFGETAVDLGYLPGEKLFSLVARQVEEIVYAVLLCSDGMFFFLDGFDDGRVASHHCLPVGGLLMEGVRRMDEMRYFRDKIPSDQHIPVRVPGRTRPEEDGSIWDAIDGARCVEDLARVVGQGEFEITRALFQMVQSGRVGIQAPRATGVEAMVALFNEAMRALFVELDAMGRGEEERQQLASFATSGGVYDALFQGAGPHADGSLDHQRIEDNVKRLAGEEGEGMLKQWLYEYVAFALFLAETALRGGGERGRAAAKRVAALTAGLAPGGG